MAHGSPRADYDAIAPFYDSGPGRAKALDPELLAFLENRASSDAPWLLDIACGTGNQLIANRAAVPEANMVGVERSSGMLRQAWQKSRNIAWVQADAAALPFPAASFDFISCQFAIHHFQDKAGMLREAFRVLRPGGRFALRNLCPQESSDWLYYEYFPEAQRADLRDFWPPAAVVASMEGIGFATVSMDYEHLHFEQDLPQWIEIVRRRDTCSQLLAITDTAYEAGLRRLERELEQGTTPQRRADHLCLLTIRGDKPCS
ncbi:MAG: methyltransferase domain-containing protein [Acetobacteraceae bacterium]|nr:methyltransferase domain-containing protein [Acetobacteraceae bacterium]